MKNLLAAALVLVAPVPVMGQELPDPVLEARERFKLFTECQPVRLYVSANEEAVELGITEERLRTVAESRLRAARLFLAEGSGPAFLVEVSVVGFAFDISLALHRNLWNPYTETWGRVITWTGGTFGTHGGDSSYIMQGGSENMDRFIGDYLRVNEAACPRAVRTREPADVRDGEARGVGTEERGLR